MRRREFLSVTSATIVSGAGCLNRQAPRARVAYVWLVNDRDEACDIDVVIEDADEVVFSETYHLGPDPDTAVLTDDRPIEESGRYVVRATMGGESRDVDTTEYVEGDEDCVGVRFSLLNNGSVDYWVKSMRQC